MTTFLRDMSHFDGDTSLAGFTGATHKLTEGRTYIDPAYAGRMPRLRAAGRVLGSYHVLHTTDPAGQLDFWIAQQDKLTPWWRDWPHWVMQVDAERWPTDNVSAATVLQFARMLVDAGLPGWKVTYASRGQYGDSLSGIVTPLWNAAYHSSTYPGDAAADWRPYSGRTPVLWQYTSTPYDKSAFRGSPAELLAMIGGTMALDPDEARTLGNCERYLEAAVLGHPTVHLETSTGHFADFDVKLGAAQLTDAQFTDLKAAVVAAQPSAADVAAHIDVQALAAALAAHFHVA